MGDNKKKKNRGEESNVDAVNKHLNTDHERNGEEGLRTRGLCGTSVVDPELFIPDPTLEKFRILFRIRIQIRIGQTIFITIKKKLYRS